VVESTSPTTSVQFVAADLGIGIVPDIALIRRTVLPGGSVKQIRVQPEPPSSVVALIFREGASNPRVAQLRGVLAEVFRAASVN
jgi:DNA-binding transcriptional LysR family regulator